MLLQLTVENFRSISDEVELSMRASDEVPRQESDRARPVVANVGAHLKVLRCAAIYGANASGKSNLVEALQVARRLVVHGTSSKDERLGVQPFLLDATRQGQPSRFELYLLVGDQVYGYGFAATNRGITEESLTMMLDGVETEVFARRDGQVRIAEALATELEDPKFLEYVARGTPENQLFLHEAMLRNVASRPIGDVFRWFEDHLRIIRPSPTPTELVRLADADPEFREFLMRAVAWADTGIKQIYVDRRRRVAQRATQKRHRLGISNPCFELWLLLHFEAVDLEASRWPDPPRRSQEAKRLLSRSRSEHGARDTDSSTAFQAMIRAEQLLQATPPGQRWPSFPGTHVHMILDDLRSAKLLPTE